MTAVYAYVHTEPYRIMFLHICYMLFKHTDWHLDLLKSLNAVKNNRQTINSSYIHPPLG